MPRSQRRTRSPLPLVIVLVLAGAGAAVLTRPDAWPEPLLAALPAPQPQLQPQDFPLTRAVKACCSASSMPPIATGSPGPNRFLAAAPATSTNAAPVIHL